MTATVADLANARVWDERPGRYEVWYLTFDHAASDTSYWIRYTLHAPIDGGGEPYAALWFARFDARRPERTVAFHRAFPIGTMRATREPFEVRIGQSRLTSGAARGELAGAGHAAAWDLTWAPADEVHRQLPDVIYGGGGGAGRAESAVCSPNLLVAMSGTVTVDGETVALAGAPGGQTHLWGGKRPVAYAWGRCVFRDRPDAVIEVFSTRLRRRGITLPRITLVGGRLGAEHLRMNQFRHALYNRATWDTGRISFRASDGRTRVVGELTARPEDLVVATYHDPDGAPAYCANTEVGTGWMTIARRRGLRWVEEARLTGRAHFEVLERTRDPRVAKDHVLVE